MAAKALFSALGLVIAACAVADGSESIRSAPPDTTPYVRPLVTEDLAPKNAPAIPPASKTPDKNPKQDQTSQSIRSAPADTTPYVQPLLPEHRKP